MDTAIISAIAKNQLLRIKPAAERRNKRTLDAGYVPSKNSVDYATWTFENCAAQIRARRSISGTVLEVGPGGNVATTLLFLKNGCERGYCVDVFPLISNQAHLYRELADNAEDLLERIEYRCPEGIEDIGLPDGTIDIIFSNACLEHVADPAAAVRRMASLLSPGGVMTHGIDLRDHRDFARPHDFLRYPDWVWQAASSRRIHTNRWRASDWQRAFEGAGLVDVSVDVREDLPVTDAQRRRFNRRFRNMSLDDLAILQIEITATKPGSADSPASTQSAGRNVYGATDS